MNEIDSNRQQMYSLHKVIVPTVASYHEQGLKSGVFEFAPLSLGLALTIGHTLRRVIMNQSMNCSVVGIKIDGVNNEFSPVHGVRQDMVQIISVLRAMPIACDSTFTGLKSVSVKISGKNSEFNIQHITCADLPYSSGITFPVKDYHIFDTTGSDDIYMEIWIACGAAADSGLEFFANAENEELYSNTEIIRIPPNFNRVNVAVNTQHIDKGGKSYDFLSVTINTDGAKSAYAFMEEGLANIKRIADAMYTINFSHALQQQVVADITVYKNKPLSLLALNQAILQCLEDAGLNTVGQLIEAKNIATIPGLTDAIVEKIQVALHGLNPELFLCSKGRGNSQL